MFIRRIGKLFSHPQKSDSLLGSLKIGDVIVGKVIKKLSDTKYTIRLKGEDVTAESENILKERVRYNFEVTNLKPKISLKISVPNLETLEGRLEFLNQLNLPHSKISLLFLSFFVENKLQFNRSELLNLLSILNSLFPVVKNEEEVKKKIKAVLFLYQKRIPVTKDAVEIICNYLFNQPRVDKTVDELRILLEKYIDSESPSEKSEKELAQSILLYFDRLKFTGDGEKDIKILKDYFTLLGLDYEANISNLIDDENRLSQLQNQPVLKKDLLLFLNILNEKISLFPENVKFYEILRDSVEKMLKFIEFQQIMNYSIGGKKEDIFYYLAPFVYEDKIFLTDVIFKREKGYKDVHKKVHITMFVFFNDECIRIDVEFAQKDLLITFKGENESILGALERFQSDLKDAVQLHGFNIKNITFYKEKNVLKEREMILTKSVIGDIKNINVVV